MVRRYTKKTSRGSKHSEELKHGSKVSWVDGMGFESTGTVIDGIKETIVTIKRRDGRIVKVKNSNLYNIR